MSLNTRIFLPYQLFLSFKPGFHFVYYTYMSNQKIVFLHNAKMINVILIKIIIAHNNFFHSAKTPNVSRFLQPFATHRYTYIHKTTLNLPCDAYIVIHTCILTITYITSLNNTQI